MKDKCITRFLGDIKPIKGIMLASWDMFLLLGERPN